MTVQGGQSPVPREKAVEQVEQDQQPSCCKRADDLRDALLLERESHGPVTPKGAEDLLRYTPASLVGSRAPGGLSFEQLPCAQGWRPPSCQSGVRVALSLTPWEVNKVVQREAKHLGLRKVPPKACCLVHLVWRPAQKFEDGWSAQTANMAQPEAAH